MCDWKCNCLHLVMVCNVGVIYLQETDIHVFRTSWFQASQVICIVSLFDILPYIQISNNFVNTCNLKVNCRPNYTWIDSKYVCSKEISMVWNVHSETEYLCG